MSQQAGPPRRPRKFEQAVSVAYLRHLGSSQEDAAFATGINRRTIGRWEHADWWPEAQRIAAERWLAGLAGKARCSLESAVGDDGNLALRVLERLEPALAPPRVRVDVAAVPYEELTDEQLAQIAAGADPAAVLAGG